MSIFGTIMSKIFGHPAASPAETETTAPALSAPAGTTSSATTGAAGSDNVSPAEAQAANTAAASASPVDVEAILTDLAAHHKEKLDWRKSIVDLMKLLGLDSSLTARKDLATELHYSGDMEDSATMNIWLHKQVMTKLAENGGKVPEDLKN